MFRFCDAIRKLNQCPALRPFNLAPAAFAVLVLCGNAAAEKYQGVGRAATPAEIQAWDIDVRPDFKGLPKGAGSVDRGLELFESQCASCHGSFGESNEVFTPLVGGTTANDIKSGHTLALKTGTVPQRTTFMKVASISTLFDYIQRAMPWTSPKSLKPDDVYAVLAYLLNLAEIVPADFVLSDTNIAEVQQRMPNRNGMTTNHGMWPGKTFGNGGKPDVHNTACMKNCKSEVRIVSMLPEHAWDAHGNLEEQSRQIGEVRYKQTGTVKDGAVKPSAATQHPGLKLAQESACMACHGVKNKIVGPSYAEVATRYKGQTDAKAKLSAKIKQGGAGSWGDVPMPANSLPEETIHALVEWILAGSPETK